MSHETTWNLLLNSPVSDTDHRIIFSDSTSRHLIDITLATTNIQQLTTQIVNTKWTAAALMEYLNTQVHDLS